MEKSILEGWLEEGLSRAEMGARAGRDPTTIGYWLAKHGLEARGRHTHAPRGALDRDVLAELAGRGLVKSEIARELGVSYQRVRYWLERHGLETRRQRGRAQTLGIQPGQTVQLECKRHGLADFLAETSGSLRCLRCRSHWVMTRRRKVKQILVAEAGGKCRLCGYGRYAGALHFHHVDAQAKRFSLAQAGHTRSLASAREEARRCALLCANCHAEVEGGIVSLDAVVGETTPSTDQE